VGDTGGIDNASPQAWVAAKILDQFENTTGEDRPVFFYHLGDVVYFNGEWSKYYGQFFNVYDGYQAPIFAIPGNHDGLPVSQSAGDEAVSGISTFVKVFCDTKPRQLTVPGSNNIGRQSMIQPNVYWTLQTPLANFIGLYTNVSEGQGYVDSTQKAWLINELKNAGKEQSTKAVIVTLHHPPYSVDKDHGASEDMRTLLSSAFTSSGVTADLVLSGHVHNYQRFTVNNPDGSQVPYLVCGAGGYHNPSLVDSKNVPVDTPTSAIPGYGSNVTFEKYCDDHWGFLRITIENSGGQRTLLAEYFNAPLPSQPKGNPAVKFDAFQINLNTHRISNLMD
jgi:3',5'-cyclic AMP phosphodiesterase CpdA